MRIMLSVDRRAHNGSSCVKRCSSAACSAADSDLFFDRRVRPKPDVILGRLCRERRRLTLRVTFRLCRLRLFSLAFQFALPAMPLAQTPRQIGRDVADFVRSALALPDLLTHIAPNIPCALQTMALHRESGVRFTQMVVLHQLLNKSLFLRRVRGFGGRSRYLGWRRGQYGQRLDWGGKGRSRF